MRLLITGGCGFIGSHAVRYAINDDFEKIINLDSLTYSGNPKNLEGISHERYEFIHGSINDAGLVNSIIEDHEIDCIIHLAAESHVDRSIKSVQPFVETNVDGTRSILEAALSKHQRGEKINIVHVSTDEVYGSLSPDQDPFTENSHISPRNPYAATKAASDMLVGAFVNTHKMNAVITRCSNNYGPNQFPEKLIPLMALNALEGKSLPVYGDGMQIRDWIHVSDHVSGIFTSLNGLIDGRLGAGEVLNFGGDCEMTNLEMVREILEILGLEDDLIEFVSDRPGHDKRYAIDYKKSNKILGWRPMVEFSRGLRDTLNWYQENKNWVESVKTGEYREWIKHHYDN